MTVVGRIGSGGVMGCLCLYYPVNLQLPRNQLPRYPGDWELGVESWALTLVTLRGVENARLRAGPVRKRREVHVVPGARADSSQQRAVDPGHERAIQLPRALEPFAVVVHLADEDVLHLQKAARMQQRQGVREALTRSTRDMKPHIVGRLAEQVFEVRLAETRRHMIFLAVVEHPQTLFELEGVPEPPPEGDPFFAFEDGIRSTVEQLGNHARQIG